MPGEQSKAEPDVDGTPDQVNPDGESVGRSSSDGPEVEEESGAERRARQSS